MKLWTGSFRGSSITRINSSLSTVYTWFVKQSKYIYIYIYTCCFLANQSYTCSTMLLAAGNTMHDPVLSIERTLPGLRTHKGPKLIVPSAWWSSTWQIKLALPWLVFSVNPHPGSRKLVRLEGLSLLSHLWTQEGQRELDTVAVQAAEEEVWRPRWKANKGCALWSYPTCLFIYVLYLSLKTSLL